MIRLGIDLGSGWIKCTVMNSVTTEQLYQKSVNYKLIKSFDENGNIPQSKIDETIEIIKDFKREADKFGCKEVRAVATAGLRAAKNPEEFINQIEKATGVRIRVINGSEEAFYTWKGALMSFDNDEKKRYVEFDIGGGSTEISYGTKYHIIKSKSIPIGNTVLLQKFDIANRIVSDSEINGIIYFLGKQFASVNIPYDENNIYILTGSSGFLPIIRVQPSLTDELIKQKPLWTITIKMVYNLIKDLQKKVKWIYNKPPLDTDLPANIILYFLMKKLQVDWIYYSTVGLRHGLVLSEARNA